jgi:hypothetical protein
MLEIVEEFLISTVTNLNYIHEKVKEIILWEYLLPFSLELFILRFHV